MSERETFVARWSRRKRARAQDSESSQAAVPAEQEAETPELCVGAGPEKAESVLRGAAHASPLRSNVDAPGSAAEPAAVGPDANPVLNPVLQLPPIESIVAESDVRAFLAPGVPAELTRAALRRAWSTDPKIRDFIGLSENSWDFNDPGAIPGFGPLELTDELRQEIARMIGRGLEEKVPDVLPRSLPDRTQPEPTQPEPESAPAQPPPATLCPPATAPSDAEGQDAPAGVTEDSTENVAKGITEDVLGLSDPAGLDPRQRLSGRRHGSALPQ